MNISTSLASIFLISLSPGISLPTLVTASNAVETPSSVRVFSGKITFAGKITTVKDHQLKPEQVEGCMNAETMDMSDRSFLVADDGGLANVVVTVKIEDKKAIVPEKPIILDNNGCRFEPHVIVVPLGAKLTIKNSDKTSHNIHTYSKRSSTVNKTIPAGSETTVAIKRAEAFSVKCDMHAWMSAWVFVTDAPFVAITGPDGRFKMEGLPPGEYKAKLWHEALGRSSEMITIKEDGTASVEWKMSKQKKKKKSGRR